MKHKRSSRLARNPVRQYMIEQRITAKTATQLFGYADVSAFYKALRFDTIPGYERMAKMADALKVPVADLFALWRAEMARSGRRVA
jgi:hypothetical protein